MTFEDMTIKELIGELDKYHVNDAVFPTIEDRTKLIIEYRKMLALESISSALSHIDATLTDINETLKWKQ